MTTNWIGWLIGAPMIASFLIAPFLVDSLTPKLGIRLWSDISQSNQEFGEINKQICTTLIEFSIEGDSLTLGQFASGIYGDATGTPITAENEALLQRCGSIMMPQEPSINALPGTDLGAVIDRLEADIEPDELALAVISINAAEPVSERPPTDSISSLETLLSSHKNLVVVTIGANADLQSTLRQINHDRLQVCTYQETDACLIQALSQTRQLAGFDFSSFLTGGH